MTPLRRLRRAAIDVEPLRHADFRRLWLGNSLGFVGFQLTAVAVPVQVYELTGSSFWVGMLGLVGLVPLVMFGLWGGAVAEPLNWFTIWHSVTVISAIVMFALSLLLFTTLLRRGHLTWEWALAKRAALLIVAAAVMGAAIVFLKQYFAPWLASGAPLLTKIGTLGLLIAISMLVYFAAAFLIGGANLGMIRRNLNRKPVAAEDA